MNAWIRRSLQVSIVAAGLLAASATAAAASGPDMDTEHNYGIGDGNQVVAPIQVPISGCGNAVAAGGESDAMCEGGSDAVIKHGVDPELDSSHNYGIGNGNQAVVPIQVPVDICGNSGALVGEADAGCEGGSLAKIK